MYLCLCVRFVCISFIFGVLIKHWPETAADRKQEPQLNQKKAQFAIIFFFFNLIAFAHKVFFLLFSMNLFDMEMKMLCMIWALLLLPYLWECSMACDALMRLLNEFLVFGIYLKYSAGFCWFDWSYSLKGW